MKPLMRWFRSMNGWDRFKVHQHYSTLNTAADGIASGHINNKNQIEWYTYSECLLSFSLSVSYLWEKIRRFHMGTNMNNTPMSWSGHTVLLISVVIEKFPEGLGTKEDQRSILSVRSLNIHQGCSAENNGLEWHSYPSEVHTPSGSCLSWCSHSNEVENLSWQQTIVENRWHRAREDFLLRKGFRS